MDTSRPERRRDRRWVRSANERWKQRWGAVRLQSGIAAVAVHSAIFAMWPEREVAQFRNSAPAASQLIAIASQGVVPDVGTGAASADEKVAREDEQGRESASAGADDLLDALRVPVPSLAQHTPSWAAGDRYDLAPLTRLSFAPASAVLADHGLPQSAFTWPEIRNPRAMVRFLRTQYNAIHTRIMPERFVSVAIWISERGTVEWCEVQESSGDPSVDKIALSLVNEVMEFIPASRQGAPIPVAVVLSIPFQVPW